MKTGAPGPVDRSVGLLRQLVDTSPDGMLVVDTDARIVLWNREMERLSGLPAHHVVGKRAPEAFPFLVENGDDALLRSALEGHERSSRNQPFVFEGTRRRGFYEARYRPWRSETDTLLGALAVVRDVTEQRTTEQRIAETESRFKNMADVAPVLLWMSRTDGLCTFFNQTWLDFTGRSLAEEWGVGWAEGVHPEDFQLCMDSYTAAFNRREVFEAEYRLRRADGVYRWILDRGAPRYEPDGTFAGFIGSCVDITERKELEAELRRAVRTRDEFLSIASHELRTPLTSLQLQLEGLQRVLQRKPEEALASGRVASSTSAAIGQTLHLSTLVGVLLDVSRIGDGKLVLECDEFRIGELVAEVVHRMSDAALKAHVTIDVRIEHDAIGLWDRLRIDQVVTNLLSNALKYGAGKPVRLEVGGDDHRIVLTVTDEGPGIAPEHRTQLFERFARFAPSRNYGGFGLGLWIAREIVRAHGGTIGVRSELGHGAAFTVELPLRPLHDRKPAQTERGTDVRDRITQGRG